MAASDHPNASQAQAVERLFPHAAKTGISLEGILPGRYWPAWELPPDATDLDRRVQELISGRGPSRFLSRDHLEDQGISCPFYAWRVHAALANHHANGTLEGLSIERKRKLQDELETWERRIKQSEMLLGYQISLPLPVGSLYLNRGDLGEHGEDNGQAIYALRQKAHEEIKKEISRDQLIAAITRAEINRINTVTNGKSGGAAPNPWLTPFFMYMANLWVLSTGKDVPNDGVAFKSLLQSAFDVIGECNGEQEWGQAKTLRKLFKDSPDGEGFKIGEDLLSMDDEQEVARRGQLIANLIEISNGDGEYSDFVRRLAFGAIHLRDYAEGSLSFLLRETLLKRGMIDERMLSPRVALQLGWLKEATPKEIELALRSAVESAKQGDIAAVCVVDIVCNFDAEREIVESLGWTDIAESLRFSEIMAELDRRDEATPDYRRQNGDHKALCVAVAFFELGQRPSSSMSGRVHSALFG